MNEPWVSKPSGGQADQCNAMAEAVYVLCTAVQSQKAVTANLKTEQLLPFGFAMQCTACPGLLYVHTYTWCCLPVVLASQATEGWHFPCPEQEILYSLSTANAGTLVRCCCNVGPHWVNVLLHTYLYGKISHRKHL